MKHSNILFAVTLGIISATTIYSRCSKRLDCSQVIYSFSINSKAFPDNDSIFINDTIWIEINCPSSLFDKITQSTVTFSEAQNLGTVIRLHKFIGGDVLNPGVVGAAEDFEFKIIEGSPVSNSINTSTNREFLFTEIQNSYKFKVGVVPKSQGIFSLALLDAANVYTKKNKCDKAGFSITFANTNQHLYFYEQNRPGYTPNEYERTHMYCFKVK